MLFELDSMSMINYVYVAEFIYLYFYLATGLLVSFVYVHFQCIQVLVHVHPSIT